MLDGLTSEEEKILRAFQRQVDRLRKSSLLSPERLELKKTYGIDLATGKKTAAFIGYDPDQLQAQLPIFRQFMLKQEQINFLRVTNIILRRCQRNELKDWANEAKRLWKEAFRRVPSTNDQIMFDVNTSLDDALEKLFYGFGGLFHVDIDQPNEAASVAAIEGALIQTALPHLWRCLNILDSVINWWLDEIAAKVPTVEEVSRKNAASG